MIALDNKDIPNFHLNIRGEKIEVVVSINIEPRMISFIKHKKCIYRSNKFFCLVYKSQVIGQITEEKIRQIYKVTMMCLMFDAREAKIKATQEEMNIISNNLKQVSQLTLNFN